MSNLVSEIRCAFRSLNRSRTYATAFVFTLGLGIGVNTAIFSVVDAVLINPLPFPEPERLVSYNHEAPGLGVELPRPNSPRG